VGRGLTKVGKHWQRGFYCRKALCVDELGLFSVSFNMALQRGFYCRRARPVDQTGSSKESLSIYTYNWNVTAYGNPQSGVRNCCCVPLPTLRSIFGYGCPVLLFSVPNFLFSYLVYDMWHKRNACGRSEVRPAVNSPHGGYPAKTVLKMFKLIRFLDFKLSPFLECHMLSSGLFPDVCSLNTNVSEHSVWRFGTLCLFHLHRRVGMKCDCGWECGVLYVKRFGSKNSLSPHGLRLFLEPNLFPYNTPHSQPQAYFIPSRLWRWNRVFRNVRHSVPKRWHLNCRRRGITHKKA
jgi:hypothetical protein